MQSNNPVFRNSREFSGKGASGYGSPSNWGIAQGGGTATRGQPYQGQTQHPQTHVPGSGHDGAPMTIDSVVQKSALTLGLVVALAALTWVMTPNLADANPGPLIAAVTIGSLGAFALSMVNSFKRVISPGLVLAFAALEGVALGAFSKILDTMVGGGIVAPAVFGTFAAFAGTLAAYKFFDINVTDRFRRGVIAAMFGMVALSLLEVVLSMFGAGIGIFGFGGVGALFAIGGLVLGIFMLILDFDFVEQGVAHGLPERESWRAAFALTVSLVWIYTNLLRLLAIVNSD